MLFSSNIFLFLYLPSVIFIYFLLKKSFRNMFLFIVSIIFYAWGEPNFAIVMLGSIIFNYILALIIDCKKVRESKFLTYLSLAITVLGNLSVLFIFKYLDFFISNLNNIGFNIPLRNIALPIGISFFTFQAMSYVLDVYRNNAVVQTKLYNVGLYISFFPQLIAGPIVRYQTIADQIDERYENFNQFSDGVKRFIIGFAKKIILANNLAILSDAAFATSDTQRSVIFAWMGIFAYSFQILFDFSGYSDMAIGLGKMFGFEFLENFDYPYMSKSISEFWRRWHMSLGQWFRDYVYFPLGGSRVKTKSKLIFNIFIVWLLTGFWHGASWNFVLWGFMYFVLITFEKITEVPKKFKNKYSKWIYQFFTLFCVLIGWVLFRSTNITNAFNYGLSMFGLTNNNLLCNKAVRYFIENKYFFLFAFLCSTTLFKKIREKIEKSNKWIKVSADFISTIIYVFMLIWAVSYIILGSYNPFIYFNF